MKKPSRVVIAICILLIGSCFLSMASYAEPDYHRCTNFLKGYISWAKSLGVSDMPDKAHAKENNDGTAQMSYEGICVVCDPTTAHIQSVSFTFESEGSDVETCNIRAVSFFAALDTIQPPSDNSERAAVLERVLEKYATFRTTLDINRKALDEGIALPLLYDDFFGRIEKADGAISIVATMLSPSIGSQFTEERSSPVQQTSKYNPLGDTDKILGVAAVYCDKWNDIIGKSMGYNMSVDTSKVIIKKEKYESDYGVQVSAVDIDGYIVEMDENFIAYFIAVPINSGDEGLSASLSRAFALINAVTREFPNDNAEFKQRYMEYLDLYRELMNTWSAAIQNGETAQFQAEYNGKNYYFEFYQNGDQLYMGYRDRVSGSSDI